ncbi:hypothetical protein [Hyalangium gracile]|uniref:hypothetical protein n=1 Tax=Hyalangium gracile TaxID=394092 RepID=UPI001CC9D703|nr:hypothetical protein [Hyalangium gracile]
MSETRALREKLEEIQVELRRTKEHLEKLRAHQAREREPLARELEAARREVAELRIRLQKAESAGSLPPPATGIALPEPGSGERSLEATTALVALARHPASEEAAMPVLSRLLKLAPVDVRFRLAPMSPKVVARLPIARAAELRAALRAEGFLAVSCPVGPRAAAGWVRVRQFGLEEQHLSVEGILGERLRVRYPELRLVMRGRRISTQEETEHVVESHHHAGMGHHRVHRVVEVRQEQVENFVWVLGKGTRLAFTQSTHFNGLGDELASSVFENLQRLANALARRAPHVAKDERFLQMPRFTLPLVDQDRSQELLAELLFQAVEEGLWP